MKKTIIINNRELLRRYKIYREKLLHGEVDRIVIPVNGRKLSLTLMKQEARYPGDIRPLLEKLEAMGPKKRISTVRMDGEIHSMKIWKKFARKRKK